MAPVKELGVGGIFWLLFHFSRGQNLEYRSSVFLCSETKRKRLLRRLHIHPILRLLTRKLIHTPHKNRQMKQSWPCRVGWQQDKDSKCRLDRQNVDSQDF